MDHVRIVANGFRALGVALAIPALVLLFMFGGSLFSLAHPPAVEPTHPLDLGKYGIVALVQYGAIGAAKIFQIFGVIGMWAGVFMAILSIVVLVFALVLFLTGRGIAAHGRWARIVGIACSVFALLVCWGVGLNVPRGGVIIVLVIVAAAVYAFWTLGWRYAVPRY
jgi:hypothetical protein